jgi:pyridoxal 5'-phosphate synthase pdxT subunit
MATITIGVCALQGAFREHEEKLVGLKDPRIKVIEVRTADDLAKADGLIIPGGESTSMRIIGQIDGLLNALKAFVSSGKPCWGTCAGLILLSDQTVSVLGGGQVDHLHDVSTDQLDQGVIKGLQLVTCRNYFGRQMQSFQTNTNGTGCFNRFPAVFIRAPAILKVGDGVETLATITYMDREVVVAVRKGNILGTCFHPELSDDPRIHQYFLSFFN